MDTLFYAFAVLVFAAVSLLIEGAYLWWSSSRGGQAARVARRLRLMTPGAAAHEHQISILKQRRLAGSVAADRMLRRMPLALRLDHLLQQSGLRWLLSHLIGMILTGLFLGWIVVRVCDIPVAPAMLIVVGFGMVPMLMVVRLRGERMRKLEEQLPEVADFLARALRAGHSLTNVLHMLGAEMPEPIASEFRFTHEEIHYGLSMHDALHSLATRVPLTDLRYMVIAILIQRESGGNLADILSSIGCIIRARLKLIAQVRVLSAEGRLSAWVLGLLPFIVIVVMTLTNRRYISVLWTDPAGIQILWYGAGMMLVGVLWLRRLVRIKV
ncbi:type II secretion system F family protein [Massilia sp. TS11]|uniref:type II secretion system F family protein n=1 Tax=Massilia sp. TS11 TaxID=2908003 RepID=UPI001EDBB1E9|nr:type II secretion system F family protein [Massilia sp. TS11]MCG2585815.1 type II secretion system F family protein [Massilia sp. TS11]